MNKRNTELYTVEPLFEFLVKVHSEDDYTFYAGQTISGAVKITLQNEISACELEISVNGKMIVIFTPTVRKVIPVMTCYPDDEDGVDSLSVGAHEFEFNIQLPLHVISSVQSDWVQVKYSVDARLVDSTTKAVLAIASKPVNIFNNLNLNIDPMNKLKVTAHYEGDEVMLGIVSCCFNWLLSSTPSADSCIPQRGFAPFSCIPIVITITKKSLNNQQANSITIQLVQLLTWQRICKSKVVAENKVEGPKLLSEEEQVTVLEEGLGVPFLPPSGIFKKLQAAIAYKVRISIRIQNRRRPITLSMPIIIGTVPLDCVAIDVPY